jgi:hypothetical protein
MDSKNSEIDKEKSPDVLSFKRYYSEVCDEEIENAIDNFASNIPEDVLKEAFDKFKQNFDFVGKEHFGLGMDVRNLLYREGFDLGAWDSTKTGFTFCGRLQRRCAGKRIKPGFCRF